MAPEDVSHQHQCGEKGSGYSNRVKIFVPGGIKQTIAFRLADHKKNSDKEIRQVTDQLKNEDGKYTDGMNVWFTNDGLREQDGYIRIIEGSARAEFDVEGGLWSKSLGLG